MKEIVMKENSINVKPLIGNGIINSELMTVLLITSHSTIYYVLVETLESR